MCESQRLGFISKKYESGNLGCAAISSGKNDPGGVSYGSYQLSSNAGTLLAFIKPSAYAKAFDKYKPGTKEFNGVWLKLAADPAFCEAQHTYIKETHFLPVAMYYEKTVTHITEEAVHEALWSMSVQHSYKGCCKIIDAAYEMLSEEFDDKNIVESLYKARTNYIEGIAGLPDVTKKALINRYTKELAEVLQLI